MPKQTKGLFGQMAVPVTRLALKPGNGGKTAQPNFEEIIAYLSKRDKTLARLIRRVGPCDLKPERKLSLYAALAEAIVYQQLNGKAAASIFKKVRNLFPHKRFPGPERFLAASENQLRGAGLSRSKLAAIRDLSEKTLAKLLPTEQKLHRLSDEEIVERLTIVRGIGRWTVEMLLIFRLGRLDVMPTADYGVRQGFRIAYRHHALPAPGELAARAECWRPFRSVAAWYFWRAVESQATESRPNA